MKSEVIITNPEDFDKKKSEFIKDGLNKFHVLADFDRTMTKVFVDGDRIPSVISILRNYNYLDEEYSRITKGWAKYYQEIEGGDYAEEYKKEKMNEWWGKHFDLLIKKKLNKKHLEKVVESGKMQLREKSFESLDLLHEKKIPLVILSSNGLGEVINLYLEKHKKMYDNIHIITNAFEWDSEGNAIAVKKPYITAANKDETSIKSFPEIYNEIKERKNVLLLGDSLGDLGMVEGFDYNNLISVGFLNENVKDNLENYKKNFDIVITNDGSMKWVEEFVKGMK